MSLIIPENYKSNLNGRETEKAIKFIKDTFQHEIISALNLQRISAPLFVRPETGLNDNLNGVERPVSFDAPCIGGATLEIVHSLAKWKRMTLGRYGFNPGEGLYTDMNAIRRDEEVDNLHSMYVDQWDWEAVINKSDRTVETLKSFVERIYTAMKSTQSRVCQKFSGIENNFPEEITFITTQELEDMYPDLEPKERENKLLREKKAVFLMQIGKELKSGQRHDGRAPDYDDWELNGDILVYYPVLDMAYELQAWVSELTKIHFFRKLRLQVVRTDLNLISIRNFLIRNFLIQSAAVSVSQDCVCICLVRLISAKYRHLYGRTICVRLAKKKE